MTNDRESISTTKKGETNTNAYIWNRNAKPKFEKSNRRIRVSSLDSTAIAYIAT